MKALLPQLLIPKRTQFIAIDGLFTGHSRIN